jgi:hypothetical protein
MYVIRCRLCFILDCVFFHILNADYVVYPAVTGELTSPHSSLLGATVATYVFYSLLLSYHCSDALCDILTLKKDS